MASLMGFAIGNAIGVPVVSKSRRSLLRKPITKMEGYGTYEMDEGTWSDDTSMLIATIDSINEKCAIDIKNIADNLLSWKKFADYTPSKEVFSIGDTTKEALEAYEKNRDESPDKFGLTKVDNNDNGSLKRIIPLAFYAVERKLKDVEILELVKQVSSITHAHEISIMGCYIYVRLVMFLLNGKDKYSAYSMTKCVDYTMFSEEAQEAYSRLIKEDISKLVVKDIRSTNYIVDTLEAVIWVMLKSESFTEAIIGAVNLGEDTDTIGALTGALAGILYGYSSIPENWLEKIIKKEYLLDIFEEFSENKYK